MRLLATLSSASGWARRLAAPLPAALARAGAHAPAATLPPLASGVLGVRTLCTAQQPQPPPPRAEDIQQHAPTLGLTRGQLEERARFFAWPTDMGPLALNGIRDNVGARRTKKRRGRGIGSGRGRKSGRGMKGKKARSGNHGFVNRDGGQTKLQKAVPKFGRWYPTLEYVYLHLDTLQDAIERGRLVPPSDRPLNVKDLFDAKLITMRQRHMGVELLARGASEFRTRVDIEVQLASPEAIEAIEAAGGSLEAVYYSKLTLRALVKPEKFEVPGAPVGSRRGRMLPRPALPPPKLMRDVYTSEAHRGYLRNLKVGEVVRPQDHPKHVNLSLRQKPYYPGWSASEQQARQLGRPYIKPDGSVAEEEPEPNVSMGQVQGQRPRKNTPERPREG